LAGGGSSAKGSGYGSSYSADWCNRCRVSATLRHWAALRCTALRCAPSSCPAAFSTATAPAAPEGSSCTVDCGFALGGGGAGGAPSAAVNSLSTLNGGNKPQGKPRTAFFLAADAGQAAASTAATAAMRHDGRNLERGCSTWDSVSSSQRHTARTAAHPAPPPMVCARGAPRPEARERPEPRPERAGHAFRPPCRQE